jgi:hypothetical protein
VFRLGPSYKAVEEVANRFRKWSAEYHRDQRAGILRRIPAGEVGARDVAAGGFARRLRLISAPSGLSWSGTIEDRAFQFLARASASNIGCATSTPGSCRVQTRSIRPNPAT